MQLMQEQLDLILDPYVWILQEHANVNNLSFEFQHIVEDQVTNDQKSLASDMGIGIMEKHEDVLSLLIQSVWESIE